MTPERSPAARGFRRMALSAPEEPCLGSLTLDALRADHKPLGLAAGEVGNLWGLYHAWGRDHPLLSGYYLLAPLHGVGAVLIPGDPRAPEDFQPIASDEYFAALTASYTRAVDLVCTQVTFLESLPVSVVLDVGAEELVQDFMLAQDRPRGSTE